MKVRSILLSQLQNSVAAPKRVRFLGSPSHRFGSGKRVLQLVLLFLLLPFLLRAGTNDGSIFLYNDSPFILTAVIQASDGSYLGQFSIQPGQQRNFTTNLSPTNYVRPGAPDVSLTPYTVIWQCPSQGYYSVCSAVSPGSYIRASACQGNHFCAPKEESKQEPPASTLKKK